MMAHELDPKSYRKQLLHVSKLELRKKCKEHRVSHTGTKSQMIERILEQLHANDSENDGAFPLQHLKSQPKSKSLSLIRSKSRQRRVESARYASNADQKFSFHVAGTVAGIDGTTNIKPTVAALRMRSRSTLAKTKSFPKHKLSLQKKQSTKKMSASSLYGIGGNNFGEFGLAHTNAVQELLCLTTANNKKVTHIYTGFQYTIYHDKKNGIYWSAGYNSYGQCGHDTLQQANQEWITKFKQMKFFQQHQLEVKKVCCNISGSCSFWITQQNTIYAHGRNELYQLGVGDNLPKYTPCLVPRFTHYHVLDIQSAHLYSVALASMTSVTKCSVRYWCKECLSDNVVLSATSVRLIVAYAAQNIVYSTNKRSGEDDGDEDSDDSDDSCDSDGDVKSRDKPSRGWTRMDCFDEHNIIKIRTGSEHTLFLEDNGSVWCCGDNAFGQLGIGEEDDDEDEVPESIDSPVQIEYFKRNQIIVVDIECGLYHNLAVDKKGHVYSWGHAKRGQCGHGHGDLIDEYVHIPQRIEFENEDTRIKHIKCGNYHSFVRSTENKCYLFGSNKYKQCLEFGDVDKVMSPLFINKTVEIKTKKKQIKDVYLGCNTTKIIAY